MQTIHKNKTGGVGKSARKGITWTASAQMAKHVLDLGVGIIMARLLTPSDFGVVGACMIFLSFVSIFTSFGVTPAIVQRMELNDDYVATAQTITVALGLVSTGLMAASAELIGEIFHNPAVTKVIPVMSLIFIISSLSIVPSAILTRKMQFEKLTAASLSSSVVYGIVVVGMAAAGFGVWSLVVGPLVSMSVNVLFLTFLSKHIPVLRFNSAYCKELTGFGGAVTVSSLLNHVARNADNFIIGRYLGAEPLGLYSRAYNLATMPKEFLVSVFGAVLFPSYARLQDDPERLRSAYFKSINAIVLIALPVSALFFITSSEMIAAVYGPQWVRSITPFRILSLAGFVYTLYIPCSSLILGLGRTKAYSLLQVFYSGGIVAAVGLTFRGGIIHVAAAVACVIALGFVVYAVTVHRILPFSTASYWQSIRSAVSGTLLMVVVLVFTRYMLGRMLVNELAIFLTETAIACLVYLFCMMISRDEICMEIRGLLATRFGFLSGVV